MPSSVMNFPRIAAVSLLPAATLIFVHRAIVLVEAGREMAAAIAACNEVQVTRRIGMQRCVERRLPRQRNRRRWQSDAYIRVVRRVRFEVALSEIAVELRAHPVDDR